MYRNEHVVEPRVVACADVVVVVRHVLVEVVELQVVVQVEVLVQQIVDQGFVERIQENRS